jgi:hypothetical protein
MQQTPFLSYISFYEKIGPFIFLCSLKSSLIFLTILFSSITAVNKSNVSRTRGMNTAFISGKIKELIEQMQSTTKLTKLSTG